MSVKNVDLTVSQLINDLNNGLTWLKRDDLGYGSIETKYGANEKQVAAIRKHPALKDAETNITIFNVIDDTKNNQKNETTTTTKESAITRTSEVLQQTVVEMDAQSTEMGAAEAANIFANL